MKKIIALLIGLMAIQHQIVFALEADSELELLVVKQDSGQAVIDIYIKNPSNQKIASVQSWLQYDTSKLKWTRISVDWSPFDFVIPWETNFEWNLVKIWRSTLGDATTWNRLFVARLYFDILANWGEIKFYDYNPDGTGHVSVQVFDNWYPVNTLSSQPKWVTINWEAWQIATPSTEFNKQDWVAQNIDVNIESPRNVKVTSEAEDIIIKWEKQVGVKWYYIYYWTVSWRYLQRRFVGDVSIYKLSWLEKWKRYYFAITSLWTEDKESDYSNEVSVVIWKAVSSTSPLFKADKWGTVVSSSNEYQAKIINKAVKVKSGPDLSIMATIAILIFGLIMIFINKLKQIWKS